MTDEPDLYTEELAALDRISRSYDGLLLHRYLRRQLELCLDIGDSGALRTLNGRRSLARDLMRHMAQGIEAQTRGGHSDDSILGIRKPAGSGTSGIRRRVPLESPERDPFLDYFPDAAKPNGGGV